jgi:hypothetical protein
MVAGANDSLGEKLPRPGSPADGLEKTTGQKEGRDSESRQHRQPFDQRCLGDIEPVEGMDPDHRHDAGGLEEVDPGITRAVRHA